MKPIWSSGSISVPIPSQPGAPALTQDHARPDHAVADDHPHRHSERQASDLPLGVQDSQRGEHAAYGYGGEQERARWP